MYMKVLILGHHGWIGSKMIQILINNNVDYVTTEVRPTQKTEFENELVRLLPTHVMSFIGRTHGTIDDKNYPTIDYLEQSGKLKENIRDNLFSPVIIALLCKKYNIHYTYIGTGCIFAYDNEHPFNNEKTGFIESDTPNFFGSSYSTVKGYTDEIMHMLDDTVLNLRIRMPITSKNEPRNFITKIVNYEYICSIPNSMTVLDDLLPYVIDMARRNITGTYNLTNPGLISHNEILEMYKKYVDPNYKWKNFGVDEQNMILASKRSNNCLDTTKLQELYPQIKNIKQSIEDVLQKWNLT